MRIFDHPNTENFKCPVCGTSEDKSVALIAIEGTESGNVIEAKQVHIDCINLVLIKMEDKTEWLVQLI